MLGQIKKSLPNMPDEAIELWLKPLALSGYGWPPLVADLGKWRVALMNKGLEYWHQTHWKKTSDKLDISNFSDISRLTIRGLFESNILNRSNAFSGLYDSRNRYTNIRTYINETGKLPAPPIIFKSKGGFEILDGSHRISCLLFLREAWKNKNHKNENERLGYKPPALEHDVWIMTPPLNA